MCENQPPPRRTGQSWLFNPRFLGLTLRYRYAVTWTCDQHAGSHSSPTSSSTTSSPPATSSLEQRVSVSPSLIDVPSLAGCLCPTVFQSELFQVLFLLANYHESSSYFGPLAPPSGCFGCCPLGWQPDSPLALSFETLGLRWALLYQTSLPRLIITRTIWSEWTRSQWSPLLEAGCPLSA
jgi:hypothetical protein